MQVHDELVLEVPEAELDLVKEKLPQIMAKVDEGMLNVPLVAEVGVGMNWGRSALRLGFTLMQKCININMRLQTDVLPLFRGDYKQCQGFMYPCSILDSIVYEQ